MAASRKNVNRCNSKNVWYYTTVVNVHVQLICIYFRYLLVAQRTLSCGHLSSKSLILPYYIDMLCSWSRYPRYSECCSEECPRQLLGSNIPGHRVDLHFTEGSFAIQGGNP